MGEVAPALAVTRWLALGGGRAVLRVEPVDQGDAPLRYNLAMRLAGWIVLVMVAACSNNKDKDTPTPATVDPCSAEGLKLTGAKPAGGWEPPEGCSATGTAQTFVRSEAELARVLACPAGTSTGLDFTRHVVAFVPMMLSPSMAGITAFDDGKTITVVSIFNEPRPGEPHIAGTPVPNPMWFLFPAGSARTIADVSCK